MKTKLYAALLCAAFLLVFAASSNAAPNLTVFAGSSGALQSFGLATKVSPLCGNGTNFWSQGSTAGNGGQDPNGSPLEKGTMFIAYNGSADGVTTPPTNICVYLSVDSIVGNRLYFAVGPGGTRSKIVLGGSLTNGNKLPLVPDTIIGALPAAIQGFVNNAPIDAGVSDIRPEDAKFATVRARISLGWGTNAICSAFTATSAQTIDFNLTGNDPISGQPVPAYSTINVGAYPVVFFYNKTGVAAGDLGVLLPTDVNSHTIAAIWGGLTAKTTDLGHFAPGTFNIGGGPAPGGNPLTVLVREPISGTYNTVNWQAVHNAGTALDQESVFPAPAAGACAGPFPPVAPSANPSYVQKAGATYARAIGTGEVVKQVGLINNAVGYGFWSFSTYAGASNLNYLTVDGVDPIQTAPTGGALPQCAGSPLVCPVLPLTNVANGTYRVWNIIRVISPASGSTATDIANFVATAQNQTVAPTVHPVTDFVPFVANGQQYLSVLRSHYAAPNTGATATCTATTNVNTAVNGAVPAGLVGCPEGGGDMAGAVFTWGADIDAFLSSGGELINFLQ